MEADPTSNKGKEADPTSNKGKETFDHFGFPVGQTYAPTSLPASLDQPHMMRWARYWRRLTLRSGWIPFELRRTPELRTMVWGGIPIAFRGTVWPILLGVPRRRAAVPAGYYQGLLTPPNTGDGRMEAARCEIEKDVDRTWPRHRWLDRQALSRLLRAWAAHNVEVGYCQGLHSIAATLLLLMPEETAFWCLVQIVEVRMPTGFFGKTLWRLHGEIEVLKALLPRRAPQLLANLSASGLVLELFTAQWLLTLFSNDLPLEMAMRVWDVLCYDNSRPPVETSTAPSDGSCEGDGCAVLLAFSLAALSTLSPAVRRAEGPQAMSTAVTSGVAGMQPGAEGERFHSRARLALRWLRVEMPLLELRSAACAKVRARMALAQAVRNGLSSASSLRDAADDSSGTSRVLAYKWRLRLRRLAREARESSSRLASLASRQAAAADVSEAPSDRHTGTPVPTAPSIAGFRPTRSVMRPPRVTLITLLRRMGAGAALARGRAVSCRLQGGEKSGRLSLVAVTDGVAVADAGSRVGSRRLKL